MGLPVAEAGEGESRVEEESQVEEEARRSDPWMNFIRGFFYCLSKENPERKLGDEFGSQTINPAHISMKLS